MATFSQSKDFPPFGQNFQCKDVDPLLHNILKTIYSMLSMNKDVPINSYIVDESRANNTFFFTIENVKLGLTGHIGRNVKNGKITYLCMDKARIKWAQLEGFTEEAGFPKSFIFDHIGVFARAETITDFISFIGGGKNYTFKSGYIIAD